MTSALAAALSPFLVWHARDARWYSWTWLFISLGLACLFRAARSGDGRWLGGFLFFGIAGSSTFWPAVTVPGVGLVWLLGTRRFRSRFAESWRRQRPGARAATLAGLGSCVAVLAAWSWVTLATPVLREGTKGYRFMNVGGVKPAAVAYTAVAFATGYTIGPGPSEWHTLSLGGVAPLDLCLLFLGVMSAAGLLTLSVRAVRARSGPETAWMLAGLVSLPFIFVVVACALTDHTYAPRYAGISYPLALASIGAAIGDRGPFSPRYPCS